MSSEKYRLQFCRCCLKEIPNLYKATHLLQTPEHKIQLNENVQATSYLQCYYYCLERDCGGDNALPAVPVSMELLADYGHICLKCKEILVKVTKFIISSKINEQFLMSIFAKRSADDDGQILGQHSETDGSEDKSIEYAENEMNEEYLESSENESSSPAEEHSLDSPLEDNGKTCKDDDANAIETFEEIIIEVAKNNCNLEETAWQQAWQQSTTIKQRRLEYNLYFSCELCANVFTLERQLYEHYNNDHDEISFGFPCDICKHRFVSFKALRYHRHRDHKHYKYLDCETCGKVIVAKFYKNHKNQHVFDCDNCGKSFTSKYELHQHVKMSHNVVREKRYNCQECDRHFFSSENLELHSLSHRNNTHFSSGGYTFNCNICSKSFARPVLLKQHLESHQADIMKCPRCSKVFTRLSEIESHMRLHAVNDLDYTCKLCNQQFEQEHQLSNHMKQHKGACFQCPFCNKIFVSSLSLRQHSYHHSGWPLTCNLCAKGFSSVYLMRRHLKSTHFEQFTDRYSDDIADSLYKRHRIKEIFPKARNII